MSEPTEADYAAARAVWAWLQEDHPPDYGDAYIMAAPQLITNAHADMYRSIAAVLAAADAKDQPATSKNIPASLIERLREVSR